MSQHTRYIVQLAPCEFSGRDGPVGYIGDAQLMSLVDARRLFNLGCRMASADTPRRFPRIIKVVMETKTIITRR